MQDLEEMKESKFSDIRPDEDGDALVEMTQQAEQINLFSTVLPFVFKPT